MDFDMRSPKTALAGLLSIITMSGMLASGSAIADLYKYRDAFGHVHLTDRPMPDMKLVKRYASSGARAARPGDSLAAMQRRRDRLAPLIERAAAASGLESALVHAVIRAESAYRADAVSHMGAVGLMQLMPATAERYGVEDRRNPADNLSGGTRYLRDLLEMFDNDLTLALAAYNAGENAVIRYGRQVPPFKETQGYVRRVLDFYGRPAGSGRLAAR
jgi:soluble lytic murein transglycosylase-like protein